VTQFREVTAEVEAAHALSHLPTCLMGLGTALAYHGEGAAARAVAEEAIAISGDIGEYFRGLSYMALTHAALALGEVDTAREASAAAWQRVSFRPSRQRGSARTWP
jgi:hypothetical protein